MKNKLNLSQLLMLSRNGTNANLFIYFDFPSLMESFLSHLQQFFAFSKIDFHISEAILSFDFNEEQQSTSILLNKTKLGELSFINPSVSDFSSLVYYSSTGLLETIVLNESLFARYSVNDYIAIIHEFSSMLLGEKAFYDHLNLGGK